MGSSSESALDHDFGATYVSSVIAGDRDGGLAGRRAPHLWIEVEGVRRSTVDLFDGRLTLLVGEDGGAWAAAGRRLASAGVPIAAYQVGVGLGDLDGGLADAYGIGPDGCVLVRPDGHVAWSSTGVEATHAGDLERHVSRALGWAGITDSPRERHNRRTDVGPELGDVALVSNQS
jgi:hypothetical protein